MKASILNLTNFLTEMDSETLNNYILAGKIAAEAREYGKSLIKEGTLAVEILDKVEKKIFELNAKPAFPAQISLNETAAHYCSEDDDKTILKDQLVSLDVGVHVNGCIGDTAVTVDLSGKYSDMITASDKALENALKIIKTGISLGEIGREIEETIKSFGLNPVKNLSGHGLGIYSIHTKPSVPNYDTKEKTLLEENQVIAIEPFATNGVGMIQEKGYPTVFTLGRILPSRVDFVRKIIKEIESYDGLPFTTRWLTKKFSKQQVNYAIAEMMKNDCLLKHPPLVEISGGIVSQSEHSIIVGENARILTKLDD